MRYIIAVIVGLAILAFSSPVFADDHTWQRPTECADEDRKVSGNRSTPCKYVLPPLEKVEYIVHMVYPSCWEALVFRFPGLKPWGRMAIVDTKPFKLRVILHRIFVERPQVTGIPAWPGGAACYRRSRYIL